MSDDPDLKPDPGKKVLEIIKDMTPQQRQNAVELYDNLIKSVHDIKRFEAMTNAELAQALMDTFWVDLPVLSHNSNLIDVVIDRLKGLQ